MITIKGPSRLVFWQIIVLALLIWFLFDTMLYAEWKKQEVLDVIGDLCCQPCHYNTSEWIIPIMTKDGIE